MDSPNGNIVRFGPLELTAAEAKTMSSTVIVARLVEGGMSRLSAERVVEVQRGGHQSGRARFHPQSRSGGLA